MHSSCPFSSYCSQGTLFCVMQPLPQKPRLWGTWRVVRSEEQPVVPAACGECSNCIKIAAPNAAELLIQYLQH